tara:strand:- start:2673 stop:3668 length:996 start_codon:yes stop_codon:yes gene_type:complete
LTKNTKTAINTLVFLTLGGVLFYWAIMNQDTDELWGQIKQVNLFWVGLSVFCGVISHLLRALRWNLLLEPMNYKASTVNSFHAVIIGYLVNMALPRVGEITRPAILGKLEKIPFNKLLGTVLIERVVDIFITLFLAGIIFVIQFQLIIDFVQKLLLNQNIPSIIILLGLITVFVIAIYLAYLKRNWFYRIPIIQKFKTFIYGIIDGIKTIYSLRRKGLFIAYSLMIWTMYFLMPFLIFYAFDGTAHLGISAGFTVLLFGTIAMIIPIPGGIGTFEVIVPEALNIYGVSSSVADSYTLMTHAIQFLVIFCVGIFSTVYVIFKLKKANNNEME